MRTEDREETLQSEPTDALMSSKMDRCTDAKYWPCSPRRQKRQCVSLLEHRRSTTNRWTKSWLTRRTDVFWRKVLTTRVEESEEGECSYSESTIVFRVSEPDRHPLPQSPNHAAEETEEKDEGIYIRHRAPNNRQRSLISLVAGLPPPLVTNTNITTKTGLVSKTSVNNYSSVIVGGCQLTLARRTNIKGQHFKIIISYIFLHNNLWY